MREKWTQLVLGAIMLTDTQTWHKAMRPPARPYSGTNALPLGRARSRVRLRRHAGQSRRERLPPQ
jgi:hypothetical protein